MAAADLGAEVRRVGGQVVAGRQREMNRDYKSLIAAALDQPGYTDWQPNFDVPQLNRPRTRPADLPGNGKNAAVLLMLYCPSEVDETVLTLTRRRTDMSKHPGQISFPGGRQDDGESLMKTALRETSEEIGIDQHNIEILGKLNKVYIPPSDFTVTPFVGWHQGSPKFKAAEYEVAEILEVPIKKFLEPATLVNGPVSTWNRKDPANPEKIVAPYYAIGSNQIWGATAIMLDEFIDRLRRLSK